MKPLSAVAVAVTFILSGLSVAAWATIKPDVMGAVFIIAAAVVLLDTFWSILKSRAAAPPA